jgi:general secretion pathway protein L
VVDALIVQMPDEGGTATWAAFDATGALLTAVGRGPLASARAAVEGRRVIALVPAVEVITTQATVPAVSQTRQRQMLPYTLEDSLADDVETMSFAVGPRLESGAVAVAIAARERVAAWLAQLRDAGLVPHALYSEADGVPDVPATLTVLVKDAIIYARRPGQPPCVLEGLGIKQALAVLRGADDEAAELRNVLVYVDAAARARFEKELAALGDEFAEAEVKLAPDGLFARIAATIAQRPGTNLLQGEHAPRSNWGALLRPWRTAASLVAAAVVVGVVLEGAQYWSLRRADTDLTAAVAASCQRIVGASRQSTCESEVTRRLAAAGAGPGGEGFLTTLAAVAAARAADTRIDALSYRNRVMDLQLFVDSVPQLDEFARGVNDTHRFTTKIQSANQNDKGIDGRVQVAEAAR